MQAVFGKGRNGQAIAKRPKVTGLTRGTTLEPSQRRQDDPAQKKRGNTA